MELNKLDGMTMCDVFLVKHYNSIIHGDWRLFFGITIINQLIFYFSKLTIEALENGVFILNFEPILGLFLVFVLLTLYQ